jgi:hypothetical protein
MKVKSSRFDSLVARYYPAVYNFASRLTDDPSGSSGVNARRLREHTKSAPEPSRRGRACVNTHICCDPGWF